MELLKLSAIAALTLSLVGCGEHDYTGSYFVASNADCTTTEKTSLFTISKKGESFNLLLSPSMKDYPLESNTTYIDDGKLVAEFIQEMKIKLFGSKPGVKMKMVLNPDSGNKVFLESWVQELSSAMGTDTNDIVIDKTIKLAGKEVPNMMYELANVTQKKGLCLVQR